MLRLCEIIGLLPEELSEITGYCMATIAFGVFFGKCLYDIFTYLSDLIWTGIEFVGRLVRKHFPNVRKRKGEG